MQDVGDVLESVPEQHITKQNVDNYNWTSIVHAQMMCYMQRVQLDKLVLNNMKISDVFNIFVICYWQITHPADLRMEKSRLIIGMIFP